MLSLTIVLAFLKRVWSWILEHKAETVLILLLLWALLHIAFRDPKPEHINIQVPRQEIEEIQKKRDRELESEFKDIDRRRAEDDANIRESQQRRTPRRNVNSQELEEKLREK